MQLKKLFCLLCTLPTLAFAQTSEPCPTPSQIKLNQLKNYTAYDIDNGTLLNTKRFAEFQQAVGLFELAEWLIDAPEGEGHCYYSANGNDPSYLGVFLAKPVLTVDLSSTFWENEGLSGMRCKNVLAECRFWVEEVGGE